jgi:hypothetical protein
MIYLILLTLATAASVFLQYKIWRQTKSYVLLLPTLVIYYWSMMGGWAVTIDLLSGNALENVGFHYYSYFDKLFRIELNGSYFFSLCMFSLFFSIGCIGCGSESSFRIIAATTIDTYTEPLDIDKPCSHHGNHKLFFYQGSNWRGHIES